MGFSIGGIKTVVLRTGYIKTGLAVLSLVAAISSQAEQVISPVQAKQLFVAHDINLQIDNIKQLSSADLILKANRLSSIDDQPLAVRERLLYEISQILSQGDETPQNKQLAGILLGYQSQIKWLQQDAGYHQHIIAFPISATARATEMDWHLDRLQDQFLRSGNLQQQELLNYLAGDNIIEQQMLVEQLITQLSTPQLNTLSAAILDQRQSIATAHILAIAAQTADARLYQISIDRLENSSSLRPESIQNLAKISETLSTQQARPVLIQMIERDVLPGVAISQLAHLDEQPDQLIFELLSDVKYGADAALALAQSNNTEVLTRLEQNLQAKNKLLVRRSLLALSLSQQPEAKLIISNYSQASSDVLLNKELSQW